MSPMVRDKIELAPHASGAERTNSIELKSEPTQLKSDHDSLGYWQITKRFWKVRYRTIIRSFRSSK
jgi:hypothetical protein